MLFVIWFVLRLCRRSDKKVDSTCHMLKAIFNRVSLIGEEAETAETFQLAEEKAQRGPYWCI